MSHREDTSRDRIARIVESLDLPADVSVETRVAWAEALSAAAVAVLLPAFGGSWALSVDRALHREPAAVAEALGGSVNRDPAQFLAVVARTLVSMGVPSPAFLRHARNSLVRLLRPFAP